MIVMIINRAGVLSDAFLKSYFKLILASRTSDLDEAKKIVFQLLFNNDSRKLGSESYQQFLKTYNDLANNE